MTGSMALGMVSCIVAVFGFGTNYVPVKRVDVGDGVFFACCMAFGIWLVGLVVDHTMASRDHGFEPVAMLGGMLWMSGNLLTPLVIKKLGMGLSLSTWGLSNMLTGWATGHFGLFGVDKEAVNRAWMNYLGVAMAAVSIVLFAQAGDAPAEDSSARQVTATSVEAPPEVAAGSDLSARGDLGKPLASTDGASTSAAAVPPTTPMADFNSSGAPAASECSSRGQSDEQAAANGSTRSGFSPLGFGLAIVAGVLFGSNFDPTTVLQQKGASHSTDCMDYVVSHFTGILATAAVALACYLLAKRRRSYLSPKVILPGMLAGAIWAAAQTAWFQANAVLSLVIAFPIVTTLPGFIGMVWGLVCFGEFRSWRSRSFAFAALCCQIPGVVLIALSKA